MRHALGLPRRPRRNGVAAFGRGALLHRRASAPGVWRAARLKERIAGEGPTGSGRSAAFCESGRAARAGRLRRCFAPLTPAPTRGVCPGAARPFARYCPGSLPPPGHRRHAQRAPAVSGRGWGFRGSTAAPGRALAGARSAAAGRRPGAVLRGRRAGGRSGSNAASSGRGSIRGPGGGRRRSRPSGGAACARGGRRSRCRRPAPPGRGSGR